MSGSGEGEYEVGYGKPPKATRWIKGGRSPNPRGRPKKKLALERARSTRQIYDDIIAVMEEEVVVRTPKGQKRIRVLAERSNVAESTIHRFEASRGGMQANTLERLQSALEAAGATFLPADATGGPGVRLKA